jgi:1,4-dihydroxy-6-naphthoate synthase
LEYFGTKKNELEKKWNIDINKIFEDMILQIAISPCPNDTFIFENLYNKKVVVDGVELQFHFLDIDELNKSATANQFDIIKISFAHLRNVNATYEMLHSGGAMGYGVGPLLVKAKDDDVSISQSKIAVPGKNTTANFLLTYAYPSIEIAQKKYMIFSDVENSLLTNDCQMGVLIHEGRFTYKEKGLELICDLGELWEQREQLPIPLGCIVAKKELGKELLAKIEIAITQSITNYDENGKPIISEFIKSHADEMQEDVMMQHIDLYVNDFSKSMGNNGKLALAKMNEIMVEW